MKTTRREKYCCKKRKFDSMVRLYPFKVEHKGKVILVPFYLTIV